MTRLLTIVPSRLLMRRSCRTCRTVPVERPGMVCSPQCFEGRGR
ncbi:hypothetical protein [Nocardioides psychrotolerans]